MKHIKNFNQIDNNIINEGFKDDIAVAEKIYQDIINGKISDIKVKEKSESKTIKFTCRGHEIKVVEYAIFDDEDDYLVYVNNNKLKLKKGKDIYSANIAYQIFDAAEDFKSKPGNRDFYKDFQ